MIAWLLVACTHRLPLAEVADQRVELSAEIPPGRDPSGALSVNAVTTDWLVKGTGADRESNEWLEVASGVRVQCELYRRRAAVALFVDSGAAPGTWQVTCPLGGVNLPLEVEARQ